METETKTETPHQILKEAIEHSQAILGEGECTIPLQDCEGCQWELEESIHLLQAAVLKAKAHMPPSKYSDYYDFEN